MLLAAVVVHFEPGINHLHLIQRRTCSTSPAANSFAACMRSPIPGGGQGRNRRNGRREGQGKGESERGNERESVRARER
eukprot:1059247-Rhodomonas_salina.1